MEEAGGGELGLDLKEVFGGEDGGALVEKMEKSLSLAGE